MIWYLLYTADTGYHTDLAGSYPLSTIQHRDEAYRIDMPAAMRVVLTFGASMDCHLRGTACKFGLLPWQAC